MTPITRLSELLTEHYVFPEIASQICAALAKREAEGAYSGLNDEELAREVTLDLQSVNGDKHLRLVHHAEPLADAHDDEAVQFEQMRAWARTTANGIGTVERLDGNIGLLAIKPLIFPAVIAGEAYAAAMTLLSDADSLIIDLRECLGGEPGMVTLFLSYLFGDEPVEVSGIYERKTDRIRQAWTLPHVAGRKMAPGVPVYVLTSSKTFSGGEATAYDLKHSGRATLVGETTRGGANPRDAFRVGDHLEATIPVGASVNPVTGGNWEGTGVEPHIATPAGQALEVALEALRRA
ncbi:S41 family peptidase [Nonomuraea soli]|uniref:C-terminal processing protease CtpA/Prc n=1 Tax=Nonomuraea soli TaxID=1032476 RepID=A0A7W0CPI0_9ACTN|nr:S41 family peptidase [Nonomuraea soli]MBA2894824.1 C-terminal processing protease CtpA/Prc [Nonomuraea soli]